jgi:hypothetical protein
VNAMKTIYYVLHDNEGRILALVPKAADSAGHGLQLGWRPVPGVNQFVAEVRLTAAYARMAPHELIEQCAVRLDRKHGAATLHRRTGASTSKKAAKKGTASRGLIRLG